MKAPIKPGAPLLGSLSILLPAFGAALWIMIAKHPHAGDALNGYAGMFIYLALLLLSAGLLFAGIGCGVAGLIRRERWRFLAIIGLLINLTILLHFKG